MKSLLCLCLLWVSSLQAQQEVVTARLPSGEEIPLYHASYGVVVGVSHYDNWNLLPNSIQDAREVGEGLDKLGFEVTYVFDPSYQELERIFKDLEFKEGVEEDRLLVYFAGHGTTETLANREKLGYLVPRDGLRPGEDPAAFRDRAISIQRIEDCAKRMHFKHAMFIFDIRSSDAFFALQRMRGKPIPEDMQMSYALPVRQFIVAANQDGTRAEGSVFRRLLLDALMSGKGDLTRDGYITGTELGLYLQEEMAGNSREMQSPLFGKLRDPVLNRGDYVFVVPFDDGE